MNGWLVAFVVGGLLLIGYFFRRRSPSHSHLDRSNAIYEGVSDYYPNTIIDALHQHRASNHLIEQVDDFLTLTSTRKEFSDLYIHDGSVVIYHFRVTRDVTCDSEMYVKVD